MKKAIILIAILMAATAYGAVTITYTIADVLALEYFDAFVAQSDAHVHIHIQGSQNTADPNVPDYSLDVDFRTPVADPNVLVTVAQKKNFIKRRNALFATAVKTAHLNKLRKEANEALHAAIADPNYVDIDPNELN